MPQERLEHGIYRVLHKKRWRIRVQVVNPGDGTRRQRLVRSVVEARRQRATWLAGLDVRGAGPAHEPVATVAHAFVEYERDLRRRGKCAARTRQVRLALATTWPEFLAMPVDGVTVDHVLEFRGRREGQGRRAGTVIRDMRVLRAMFKKALGPAFVVPVTAFPAEDLTRVRWLTPTDEALAFTLIEEPFRSMARLAALTLMRQGEIRTLRRESVHLAQEIILLPRAKGGPRPVFLNREAQRILGAQLQRHDGDLVFPNPRGVAYSGVHVSRTWRKASRAAGLQGFRFHDLRHHGATVALSNNATTKHLKALGGWKSDRMVDRYAHVLDGQLRALVESLSGGVRTP